MIFILKRAQGRDMRCFAAVPQLEVGNVYINNHQIDSCEVPICVRSIVEFR